MGVEIQMNGNGGSAEHRRARRYRFRGDVTARRLGSGVTVPCRILDLSARGCRMTMPSLTPFAIDTLVEMCVSTSTVTFRAVGAVRHSIPSQSRIGISFVNLGRRGESQLNDLIALLEEAERSGRPAAHAVSVMEHTPHAPKFQIAP